MQYLLGFDIGTQSIRSVLIDIGERLMAYSTREYDIDTLGPAGPSSIQTSGGKQL